MKRVSFTEAEIDALVRKLTDDRPNAWIPAEAIALQAGTAKLCRVSSAAIRDVSTGREARAAKP